MTRHTVVIVDDHALVREGLRAVLNSASLEVVGEAATGEEAVARCEELRPDVVVMDLNLPGMSGIDATAQIVAANTAGAVLVLTMFEDDESLVDAIRAGARGYVLKGSLRDEIARAVETVATGDAVFGAAVANRVLALASEGRRVESTRLVGLTEREHDVLELLAAGLPNAQIARHLFLSTNTVRNHVSSLFTKLHVSSRAEAMLLAREAGIGEPRQS